VNGTGIVFAADRHPRHNANRPLCGHWLNEATSTTSRSHGKYPIAPGGYMNRWILFIMLVYSSIAVAQLFPKKNIAGTLYCNETFTIKEAPPEYRGKGEISQDGFTVMIPSKIEQPVLIAILTKAYEIQKSNGCVVKGLEDLLKQAN